MESAPLSKPYIAFRTDPFDQEGVVDHELIYSEATTPQTNNANSILRYDAFKEALCPLQFSMGLAQKMHTAGNNGNHANAIRTAPVLATVFAARGPGKQVIYNYYEHLDLLSPVLLVPEGTIGGSSPSKNSSSSSPNTNNNNNIITEALQQPPDFPLLLESSAFHAHPLLLDANADGILDAVSADYDGGITVLGLMTANANDDDNNKAGALPAPHAGPAPLCAPRVGGGGGGLQSDNHDDGGGRQQQQE